MSRRFVMLRRALLAPCLLLLGACASTPGADVFTDLDEAADFSAYESFGFWRPETQAEPSVRGPSPLAEARMRRAIRAALVEHGYRFSEDLAAADLVVSFAADAREDYRLRTVQRLGYVGPHWTWGHAYFPGARAGDYLVEDVVVDEFTQGTLVIDVFDTAARAPVWHGRISGRISDAQLEQEDSEEIAVAVATVLADFPIR